MIISRYELIVHGPSHPGDYDYKLEEQATKILPHILRETEENLTDLLPEGFSVSIEAKE